MNESDLKLSNIVSVFPEYIGFTKKACAVIEKRKTVGSIVVVSLFAALAFSPSCADSARVPAWEKHLGTVSTDSYRRPLTRGDGALKTL
jgi:hypothetical protein